jgi:hypothetical protein
MNLTENQKLLLLGGLVLVVLYLVFSKRENLAAASANSVSSSEDNESRDTASSDSSQSAESSLDTVVRKDDPTIPKSQSDKDLVRKMRNKDSAKEGEYKKVSYAGNTRDQTGTQSLDDFFDIGNPLNENENADYFPNDEGSNLAAYSGSPRRELSDEEKFNASALLPKEEKQDWFDDVTPQKIKNRHLINIYRPIGVNTVITSRKNPSLDLRGNPVNPKTFVSPFLNSSIEPDVNARGICV